MFNGLFSPKVVMVVAAVMGAICIGGAVLAFLYGSNNGIVLEVLLLVIGLSSLGFGAVIVRRDR